MSVIAYYQNKDKLETITLLLRNKLWTSNTPPFERIGLMSNVDIDVDDVQERRHYIIANAHISIRSAAIKQLHLKKMSQMKSINSAMQKRK